MELVACSNLATVWIEFFPWASSCLTCMPNSPRYLQTFAKMCAHPYGFILATTPKIMKVFPFTNDAIHEAFSVVHPPPGKNRSAQGKVVIRIDDRSVICLSSPSPPSTVTIALLLWSSHWYVRITHWFLLFLCGRSIKPFSESGVYFFCLSPSTTATIRSLNPKTSARGSRAAQE